MASHRIDSLLGLADSFEKRADDAAIMPEFDHRFDSPLIHRNLQFHSPEVCPHVNGVPDLMGKNERPLGLGEFSELGGNGDFPLKRVYLGEAGGVPDFDFRAKHERCGKADRSEHPHLYNEAV